ncbi:nicotinate-nucleotide--dimethylbenzimidazole phosphoribosyltransferase [Marivita sp. S2033]|uniref:nicotinate-nucleotide--dimethylbenzimidazole phosphoribosyltransferase n=1 Tax=Marivita sp. S2033 TaxID=3373187 RepID=UPI00398253E8
MTQPDFEIALRAKIDNKTKPLGALGRLESLAAQVARLQGTLSPTMQSCQLTIFAADHGIAQSGVSAYPSEVTRQMVLNFASGGAAANIFCAVNDVALRVVNAGVLGGAFGSGAVLDRPIAEGTANSLTGPAMTHAQRDAALSQGRILGQDGTADAVVFGEMGIGNSSSATLIAHFLTGLDVASLAGRGTGLDDAGLAAKRSLLTKAAARCRGLSDPAEVLAEYGGFEIAMIVGAILAAAESRRIVLIDGFIASAAALIAVRMQPETRKAMVFAHRSTEPGHGAILTALKADPLLDLGLRLGEGTGAVLAWPLLKSAVAMLNDMASFETAGVSGKA